jgi:hypothetical protein
MNSSFVSSDDGLDNGIEDDTKKLKARIAELEEENAKLQIKLQTKDVKKKLIELSDILKRGREINKKVKTLIF